MASSLLASSILALSALIGLNPPAPGLAGPAMLAPEPGAGAGTGAGTYEEALAAIDEANIAVNRDPEANVEALEGAIQDLLAFGPQVAADPQGREALDNSQLNLARALLVMKNEDKASEIMDAVLLTAYERKLPVKRFGPTLAKFADKRRRALAGMGTASIQVNCYVRCRVIVDEQQIAASGTGQLYLGRHRIWVEAEDGGAEPLRTTLELSEEGVVEVVNYPATPPASEECDNVAPLAPPPEPPPAPPRRILPRWAEIGVTVIGIGAIAAGGVLLGLDGKCPGGGDPVADAQDCPELYEGTVSGLVAIGAGSALALTGTVLLAVDEVKVGKQKGQQAVLSWRVQF